MLKRLLLSLILISTVLLSFGCYEERAERPHRAYRRRHHRREGPPDHAPAHGRRRRHGRSEEEERGYGDERPDPYNR